MTSVKIATVTLLFAASFVMLVSATTNPPPPGRICILKYDDKNGNGKQDPGEVGLPGWTFTVMPGGQTVTTDQAGRACFPKPPGAYTITEHPKNGWTAVGPTTQ